MREYSRPVQQQLPAGVPADAKAMALLIELEQKGRSRPERTVTPFLEISRFAAGYRDKPLPRLPEVDVLDALRLSLPAALQASGAAVPAAQALAQEPLVEWPVKAMTPVLVSTQTTFEEALAIADRPERWAESTPQMTIEDHQVLPRNGSLWRCSLTKHTDLGKPLVTGLRTRETIHITAEGSTSPDGKRGHRRYTHRLFSAATGPGLLRLVRDTGWIELSGDEHGIQLRIQKEAAILRPPSDPYAAILSAGFGAELWLWAMGFCQAAAGNRGAQQSIGTKPLPPHAKDIVPAANGTARVAVLGGGAAGLACAWLLSRPVSPQGNKPAWTHPGNPPLQVEVELVEAACVPGGKAASARRRDAGESARVEEHGLHMLMGCYANVLQVMQWTGAAQNLADVARTRLPGVGAATLDDLWDVELGPWDAPPQARMSLAQWTDGVNLHGIPFLSELGDKAFESRLRIARRVDEATVSPRALQRVFAGMARRMLHLLPTTDVPGSTVGLHRTMVKWLTVRLMQTELHAAYALKAEPASFDPDQLKAMATLLRQFAREGLSSNGDDPGIAQLREGLELGTTIVIGLVDAGLFPIWAVDDPDKLVEKDYADWSRGMQELDGESLREWLERYDIEPGFVAGSRVLAALTAGLFTTPDRIAAGTFLHGTARMLLTYGRAPYRRMRLGTGEAFIGPLYEQLRNSPHVTLTEGTRVESLQPGNDGRITQAGVVQETECDPADYDQVRRRWFVQPNPVAVHKPGVVAADAFVLAIPPFGGVLAGVPAPLAAALQQIGHCATVSLQCWSEGAPRFPDTVIASMPGPLRCAAAMSDLDEGPSFGVPVYACGEVDDPTALAWNADHVLRDQWLATYRPMLQTGAPGAHEPFKKVNCEGSNRYTLADPDTQAARRVVYDTGSPNLWIAGDWTRTALACGSIEAAVTSGLEAARDILEELGCTVDFPIVGAISKEPT